MSRKARGPGLLRRVEDALRSIQSRRSISKVLVAYSGGGDSTALLHLLVDLGVSTGFSVAAGHLDHAAREGSEDDAVHCRRVAGRLGIEFRSERLKGGDASEAGMRDARYRFLARSASAVSADAVATGHTMDDDVETFLLNAIRGAGPRGLAGIRADTELSGSRVVRPLLDVRREELRTFLRERGISFLDDPSNEDPARPRNRLRMRVLPEIERCRPGAKEAIRRAQSILADEAGFLETQALRDIECDGGRPSVSLFGEERALLRHRVRELFRLAAGKRRDLPLAVVEEVLSVAAASIGDRRTRFVALPGRWVMRLQKGTGSVLPGMRGKPTSPVSGFRRLLAQQFLV